MITEEQVQQALLSASWPDGGTDGFPTRTIARMMVPAVQKLLAKAWGEGHKAGFEDGDGIFEAYFYTGDEANPYEVKS